MITLGAGRLFVTFGRDRGEYARFREINPVAAVCAGRAALYLDRPWWRPRVMTDLVSESEAAELMAALDQDWPADS